MARVHLTFDNGPDPRGTPKVLEVLERHGVKATFFVLGKHLAKSWGWALAHEIRDAGHRLGNHSFSHEVPLGDDPGAEAVERELAQTQALLDEIWQGPRWFRTFGGGGKIGPHLLSAEAADWLAASGHTVVLWNSVPGDWLEPHGWVPRALEEAASQEHVVVVLHDAVPEAMDHLETFLRGLEAAGHTFVDDFPASCLPLVEGRAQPSLREVIRARS